MPIAIERVQQEPLDDLSSASRTMLERGAVVVVVVRRQVMLSMVLSMVLGRMMGMGRIAGGRMAVERGVRPAVGAGRMG